jgi:hypothetical protein
MSHDSAPPLWKSFIRCSAGMFALLPSFALWSCKLAYRKLRR